MEALVNQPEQTFQMLREVGAVLGRGAGLAAIGQVTQGLQTVAQPVDVVADGQNAQFAAAGLGVETEQNAVDIDQGLMPELLGRHRT